MGKEIVDADGHICEPPTVWQDYAEADYRDRVIQVRTGSDGRDELWIEGRPLGVDPAPACIPGALSDPQSRVTWADITPGSCDPTRRLEILDAEGIDTALLFPSIYLLWGDIRDPKVAAATCRAYNNWISDFCRHDPQRLHAVGLVPLQDMSEAVRETERIGKIGLRGIAIRPERFGGLALDDPTCDRLWAAARSGGLAVSVHGSFGSGMPSFATQRYTNLFFTHMICHPFEQMAACLDVVCGGVLQRFPELRVGFFESGLGWLPYWLARMDDHYERMGHLAPWLERRPSDAFRSQCFVSMDPGEPFALGEVVRLGLAGCVLWGSDYPHYDCVYPGALKATEQSFAAVGETVRDRILLDNPRRFMGLA
jgi:predicted TIM-barrel fold metal-dependent hydrolase